MSVRTLTHVVAPAPRLRDHTIANTPVPPDPPPTRPLPDLPDEPTPMPLPADPPMPNPGDPMS